MKKSNSKLRLRELMDYFNINQTELCNRTGLQKSALSNYLNGDRDPRQDQISLIADPFGINPAWLMGYDVSMFLEMSATEPTALVLSDMEIKIIEAYRRCTPELKTALHGFLGIKGGAEECETEERSSVSQ